MKTFVLIMAAFVILFGLMSTWFFVRRVSGTQETLREIDSLNSALAEDIVCQVIPAIAVESVVAPDYLVIPQNADSDSLLTLATSLLDNENQGDCYGVVVAAPSDQTLAGDEATAPASLSDAERQRLRQYEIDRRKEVFDILNGGE